MPRKALEQAIKKELGMRNRHQIEAHIKTLIPASVNAIRCPPSTSSSNWSLSKNFHRQGYRAPPLYWSIFAEV